MSAFRLALAIAALKIITSLPIMWSLGQEAIRSYTVAMTVNSLSTGNLTEETRQRVKQMETDMKYFGDLLHAGIATADTARDLINNLQSAKEDMMRQHENLMLASQALSEGEDIYKMYWDLVLNAGAFFLVSIEITRLLLALGSTQWKKPRFLACLVAFAPLVRLADPDTELEWEAHWQQRGGHLIPAQLSELQEFIMNFSFHTASIGSILPFEFTLLPLESMTFNNWLLADTLVCILNIVFIVCCFQAAMREGDNEGKLKPTAQRKKLKTEIAFKVNSDATFLHACLYGLTNIARSILKNPDFNINCFTDLTNDTGLHLACHKKHVSVVQMILERARKCKKGSWCLNARNADGQTPLMLAAASSSADIVARLLKTNRVELGEDFGAVPVATAIKNNNLEIAEAIYSRMKEKKISLKDLSIEVCIESVLAFSKEIASKSLSEAKLSDRKNSIRFYKEKIIAALLANPTESDSRRKSESPEEMLKRTLSELQELCECLVCNEPFAARGIFACENDHWLCGECKMKMLRNRCPLCGEDFDVKPARRCINVEKVARLVNQLPPLTNDK